MLFIAPIFRYFMNKQQNNIPQAGKETIEKVKRSVVYIIYNYLHSDGTSFRCIRQTMEDCRKSKDLWLKKCCLPETGQIVSCIQFSKNYLIFNPNIKGYVLLIEIDTAQIRSIHRSRFFQQFNIFSTDNQSGRIADAEAYTLMLKAYHLQFSKTRKIINKL